MFATTGVRVSYRNTRGAVKRQSLRHKRGDADAIPCRKAW